MNERQFCETCGVVLSDIFYKCRKCNRITCANCQNKEMRCCVECAEVESYGVAPKMSKSRAATRRKPNPAFMRPMTLSSELAAIVGEGPMPRTEVTKRLWVYIKEHGLQDSTNRRMINADEKLAAVFGGKTQVSMFEMTALVAKHITKS